MPTRVDGKVVYEDGITAYDCMLLDTSATGARIQTEPGTAVPASFYLINVRARMGHLVTKVWQTGDAVGIRFETNFAVDEALPQDLFHLYQYWLESAANG